MIDLDAFQEKWAEQDRKLDISIRLNRRLLMAANMNRVRSPLQRFAFFLGLEALIGLAVTMILGQFIYEHWAEARFVLPALALHVWVIANVAASIRQMAMRCISTTMTRLPRSKSSLSPCECCGFGLRNGLC